MNVKIAIFELISSCWAELVLLTRKLRSREWRNFSHGKVSTKDNRNFYERAVYFSYQYISSKLLLFWVAVFLDIFDIYIFMGFSTYLVGNFARYSACIFAHRMSKDK